VLGCHRNLPLVRRPLVATGTGPALKNRAQFSCRHMSLLNPLRAVKRALQDGAMPWVQPHRNHCLMFPRYLRAVADLSCVPRQPVKAMQSLETTSPVEARRVRYAQFRGQKATLTFMGSTVTGLVRSGKEDATSKPPR
jgi:hypothetical protein